MDFYLLEFSQWPLVSQARPSHASSFSCEGLACETKWPHGYSIAELHSPIELFFATSKIVARSWLELVGYALGNSKHCVPI